MIRRILAGLVLAATVVGASSGCQIRPGTAAYVGDTRITMEQVDGEFQRAADDPISRPIVEENGGRVRNVIVQTLVQTEVLRHAAAAEKVTIGKAEIARLESDLTRNRAQLDATRRVLPVPVLAEYVAYERSLLGRFTNTGMSEDDAVKRFLALVASTVKDSPVTMNPRFGAFDPARFALVPGMDRAVTDLPGTPQAP